MEKSRRKEAQLEKQIEQVKQRMVELGEVFPGAMKPQYNICGSPGCKCKDKKNPIKHGPYYNLSFTFEGKSHTKFIRKELIPSFKRYTANYKKLREYIDKLIALNIELVEIRSKK